MTLLKALILLLNISVTNEDDNGHLRDTEVPENLLLNSRFTTDAFNWYNVFTFGEWVSDDGAPEPGSGPGSMRVTGNGNNNASFNKFSDAFVIQPDYTYQVSASYKVPSDSSVPRAWMEFGYYDINSDPAGFSDSVDTEFGVPTDQWNNFHGYIKVPSSGVSLAELRIYFQSGPPEDVRTPYGLWDDVYVIPDTMIIGNFD